MKKDSSKIGIVPLEDRVLIVEVKEDAGEKTKSGILLPGTDKNTDIKRGKVVAVGEGRFDRGSRVPMQVKIGDTVLYSWGEKIKVEGEEYTLLRESEIAAIVK